jgi:hypothetical protein
MRLPMPGACASLSRFESSGTSNQEDITAKNQRPNMTYKNRDKERAATFKKLLLSMLPASHPWFARRKNAG